MLQSHRLVLTLLRVQMSAGGVAVLVPTVKIEILQETVAHGLIPIQILQRMKMAIRVLLLIRLTYRPPMNLCNLRQ